MRTGFGRSGGDAIRRIPAAHRAADGLAFAASPTFAIMALVTAAHGGNVADILCAPMDSSLLNGMTNGMTLMYALMSAFHSAPWVRLISGRRDSRTTE